MAIVGSGWSDTLYAVLQGKGMNGSRLKDFCDAVGLGSAAHVIGKSFTTTDAGTVPGVGAGSGTGITGMSSANLSDTIFALLSGVGFGGSKLKDFCDAVAQATVVEMAKATLTSTHGPVFAGAGSVDVGSVGVVGPDWGNSIKALGLGFGMNGSKWGDFATAMGSGKALEILATGTGSVTIAGSPTGIPVPGAGAGSGTIS